MAVAVAVWLWTGSLSLQAHQVSIEFIAAVKTIFFLSTFLEFLKNFRWTFLAKKMLKIAGN
jgi:hypothetical protein